MSSGGHSDISIKNTTWKKEHSTKEMIQSDDFRIVLSNSKSEETS